MPTPLETVRLEHGDTHARIAPDRGGTLTRLVVAGREVLYLDEATLLDPTKNVRGGNPVLFPSPGPLAGDRFAWGGRTGTMKQHGLARQRPWTVVAQDASSVSLSLTSHPSTLAEFPWSFALLFRYVVTEGLIRIEQRFENRDDAPMPYAAGFHPYFRVADKTRASIPTRATRAWDNVAKREVAVAGPLRFGSEEVDLHLVDHGEPRATLDVGDGTRIEVSGSDAFWRWVIWTLPGKDFICLEPWTAASNALGSGEHVRVIAPGQSDELWTEIAVARTGPAPG